MPPPPPPPAPPQGPPPSGPPPSGPPPGPPAGGPSEPKRRPTIILVALVLVVALVAALIVVVATGDDGDDGLALGEGEIFLEPAAEVGPEPFSGEVFGDAVSVTTATSTATTATTTTTATTATTTAATTSTTSTGGATVVAARSGAEPGLYGGTRQRSHCDAGAMLAFLQANPDKAAAFVGALNADPDLRWRGGTLRVEDLPAYFAELTPLVLTTDTRVTNHGFRDGRPTPRQAVLQAGTAVLVDTFGVPRARCFCGNPLIPPTPTATRPTYVGPAWPTFNQTNVVVIQDNDVEINIFVVKDVEGGDDFERPAGTSGDQDTPVTTTTVPTTTTTIPLPEGVTLGEGDVQVTLQWVGNSDMDLHVIDPTGTEISFSNTTSPSGGQLDVDQIPGCSAGDAPHVENVFWPPGGAPAGEYQAFVRQFSSCGHDQSYVLIVRVRGEVIYNQGGTLGGEGTSEPFVFTV